MFSVNLISFHKLNQRMFPFYFVTAIPINTGVAFKLNILLPEKLNYNDNTTCFTKNGFSKGKDMMTTIFQFLLYILH